MEISEAGIYVGLRQRTRLCTLVLTSRWVWAAAAGNITLDEIALFDQGQVPRKNLFVSHQQTVLAVGEVSVSNLKGRIRVMHPRISCRKAPVHSCILPQFASLFFFLMKIILYFSLSSFPPPSLHLQISS